MVSVAEGAQLITKPKPRTATNIDEGLDNKYTASPHE